MRESEKEQGGRGGSPAGTRLSLPDAQGRKTFAEQFADIFAVVASGRGPAEQQIPANAQSEQTLNGLPQSGGRA
jgi:hypothetical protein